MANPHRCFSIEKPEDCVAPCVLEYQAGAEDEDPICVPSVNVLNLFPANRHDATDLVKKIVRRLLPKEDSEAFAEAFRTLHKPLFRYMDTKLAKEIRSINHATWQDSCKKIASRIMNEINNTDCGICMENLNDNEDNEMLAYSKCCSNIAHYTCLLKNAEIRGQVCPWCAEPVLQIAPGLGQQFPDPARVPDPDRVHGVSLYKTVIACLVIYLLSVAVRVST